MESHHGICEKVLSNGDTYVGKFEELLPHGMGKYTWLDGTIYEGEWEKSRTTGRAHISWPSGATYAGDVSGGFLHGFGTYTGIDGSVYKGSWRMNIQHGFGRKNYCNSNSYEGSWQEGVQEGIGRFVWNNGNNYIGNWKNGKMSRKGIMKWSNCDMYEGQWLDGLRHGYGCYRFADGSYYVGTWTKGLKDGLGTFYPVDSKHPSLENLTESSGFANELNCFPSDPHLPSSNINKSKNLSYKNAWYKWSLIGFLRHSKQISHRSASVDRVRSLGDNSLQNSFTGCSCSPKGHSSMVYEREYVQGVLIAERAVHPAFKVPNSRKLHQKYQREVSRSLSNTVIEGDRSFCLMLNLQLGIRYTVGKITPVPKREVSSSDFGPQARIQMSFPSRGSEFTPPHYSLGFFWKDYRPMVFRNLREMFKIDASDYMVSICGADGLKELSSPGKSGSIFYLSQDESFVLKTLRKDELKVLLKMLPGYYNHVKAFENTLITKFFGLHRITLRGRKVRFVVMGNMFCTELRIHRRYDLKGSSHGRSTTKCKIDENTTMKDLDLSYVFLLEKSWHEALFRQISLDCSFLESQHIIDYSLLLGLHFRAPEHLRPHIEPQDPVPNISSLPVDGGGSILPSKGLRLVAHDPDIVSTMRGSHIRGSTLRASAIGGEEADLLLPDTGRHQVQLGVNMPALTNHKVLHEESAGSASAVDLYEACDVVLYFGIIDILQEYNMTKRAEHAWKSLKCDPLSISSVAPNLYSRRFINFLEKVFPVQM